MRGWAIATLLTACYAPKPPQGAPCGPADTCPAGQMCIAGLCTSSGSGTDDDANTTLDDAGLDASDATPMLDAMPDGPPIPPVMRFGARTGAEDGALDDVFLDGQNNWGVHIDLHVTDDPYGPVLIRANLASVPTNANVTSARLSLYVSYQDFPMGTKLDVFVMNESWTEGDKDNAVGVANVDERNAGEMWSASGARSPSRDANAVATTTIAADTGPDGEVSITIPPAVVEGWIATPSSNHGIAIVVQNTGFYAEVRSTESTEADKRPMLELMLE